MLHATPLVPALLLAAAPLQDRGSGVAPDLRYRELQHLVAELRRTHPDPFHGVDEEAFAEAQVALEDRLGDLDDDGFAVELMRLVGLTAQNGREGHAVVLPVGRWHVLPLRLYAFPDGWHVVAARAPHGSLVGERVTAVGGVPVAELAERLAPLVCCDNGHDRAAKLPVYALMPELLHTLGIGDARDRVTLTLAGEPPQEEQRAVTLESLPFGEYMAWTRGGRPPLPPTGDALWLSDPGRAWWSTVLEGAAAGGGDALYAQYNAVRSSDPAEGPLAAFAEELVSTFEERGLDRVVLDLRLNGGGDNTTFGPLIEALRRSPTLNRRGRLYALVGRHTFSAAGNFTTVLERDTEAILVGEPTGGAPNQYGDARAVTLEHHPWLLVRLATRYHAFGGPDDARLTHTPELAVPLTAADYFSGRDPVLRRALEHEASEGRR